MPRGLPGQTHDAASAVGFTHYDAVGEVVEQHSPTVDRCGMQFQALAAEGNFYGELMTWDDSVAIMGTLDEIRRQIGLSYHGEL